MIKVNEKQIIKGQEPVSGVILTLDEYAEVDGAHEEKLAEAEEAEAANKEAEEQLEALSAKKSEKETSADALQADLEKLADTMDYLTNLLKKEERLNKALMKVKEEAK